MSWGAYGCGSAGGGTVELKTSTVTASAKTTILDADVVKWTDATTCTGASIPAADSVDVEVISKAYANTGSMGQSIRIESVTVSYTPANSATPAMASEFQTVGMTIPNGSTATVPVRVVTQEQKIRLQSKLACNTPIYNYYANISLNITEIGTDTKSTVQTSMQLRLADFIDK
jgi:hypothetical protein